MPEGRRLFSQILLASGLLMRRDLLTAISVADRERKPLHDVLVQLGFVSELESYKALSQVSQLPLIDLDAEPPEIQAIKLVPHKVAWRHRIVPVRLENRALVVATAFVDEQVARDLGFVTSHRVQTVIATRSQIDRCLERYYPGEPEARTPPAAVAARQAAPAMLVESHDLSFVPSSSPIELCHQLIAGAVQVGASDVHIEATDNGASVRYRVAGILEPALTLPREWTRAVCNRFKVLARVDISTRSRPQDGAFQVRLDRPIDVRLSSVPTVEGETLVLRVIDTHAGSTSLDNLGYKQSRVDTIRWALDRPDGLVLVTGPPGSGKTTVLYAALHHVNDGRRKVVSIEDPVERRLAGVTQISVTRDTDAATALSSVLRQDPNVIMVGEIRDPAVAQVVGQAAYTGHLVLSSLHTGDAPTVVTRLLNLGLESYRIAESLSIVVAQRLVRVLCRSCRVLNTDIESRRLAEQHGIAAMPARAGFGCGACRQTGYSGRRPVVEILVPDEQIREAIARGARPTELRAMLKSAGWVTMRDEAVSLVEQGITTIEEADRLLAPDSAASPAAKPLARVIQYRRDQVG